MTLALDRPRAWGLENRAQPQTTLDEQFVQGFAEANLVVSVEADDGRFFATTDVIPMYGEGDSPDAAFFDLLASMENLRRELTPNRARLSPELAEQLRRLEAMRLVGTAPLF